MADFIFQKSQSVSFHDFMNLALYDPTHGYYRKNITRQGADGDYITAPSMSDLFAHCLANTVIPLLKNYPNWSIAEIGPGSASLAIDLLRRLKPEQLPKSYHLIEPTPPLQLAQQQRIFQSCPPPAYKTCSWASDLPQNFQGIIIANEILDALPVHLLQTDEQCSLQTVNVIDQNNQLSLDYAPIDTSISQIFHDRNIPLYPNYRYEISTAIPPFIDKISQSLQSGICLLLDYGYSRKHYYHPHRSMGTLTSFYQHRRNDNILEQPGNQDISVHVDFTLVAESAHCAGMQIHGYTNQEQFLLANDLTQILHEKKSQCSQTEFARIRKHAHTLTSPLEMGETIKVIALGKSIPQATPLMGFRLGTLPL